MLSTSVMPINTDLATTLFKVGQFANQVASQFVFEDYRERKSLNTLRRQDTDLSLFAAYLSKRGLPAGDFAHDPEAWRGATWGLVEGFIRWQLKEGYAVQSVNIRLSTIKGYSKLALKAGTLDHTEYALIRAVDGYSHKEVKRVDERRTIDEIPTRKGYKKAEAVLLTKDQGKALKTHPDTPQGRRDALLMCLLLDHGLRCGEVAILQVEHFDLSTGEFTFYRPKVDRIQTHRMTTDTLKAARAYFENDAPLTGSLWLGSRKDGSLRDNLGMSTRAITGRVEVLGDAIGVKGLSAHDCRHNWATQASRNGTPIDRLQDAGGWSSPAMPLRYVSLAAIANMGVELG